MASPPPELLALRVVTVRGSPAEMGAQHGAALTAEEQHQHFLERVMLGLGGVILFFLLFL